MKKVVCWRTYFPFLLFSVCLMHFSADAKIDDEKFKSLKINFSAPQSENKQSNSTEKDLSTIDPLQTKESREDGTQQPKLTKTLELSNSPMKVSDLSKQKNTKPVEETSQALRIILGLTLLAIIPAILISVTAFLRIIIVLSMLRHAIGMPETPPNSALIGIALFLTLFTMSPTLQVVNTNAFQPYMDGKISATVAYEKASAPMRDFMVRQTREQDLALMVELSKAKTPESMDDIGNLQLIPAFMLSELRTAFQIGFVIFLPFLLIDLIVSSILMALGMMMMPPISISLPLKILMFILVDGWSLILKALVGSFH